MFARYGEVIDAIICRHKIQQVSAFSFSNFVFNKSLYFTPFFRRIRRNKVAMASSTWQLKKERHWPCNIWQPMMLMGFDLIR
jgi:hypothetical protein